MHVARAVAVHNQQHCTAEPHERPCVDRYLQHAQSRVVDVHRGQGWIGAHRAVHQLAQLADAEQVQ